jgi:hypothetical protein
VFWPIARYHRRDQPKHQGRQRFRAPESDPGTESFRENLLMCAQTLGTILTRASWTAFSRSASCWGSWYGMARMR